MNIYCEVHQNKDGQHADLGMLYELDGPLIVLHGASSLCSGPNMMGHVFRMVILSEVGGQVYVMGE